MNSGKRHNAVTVFCCAIALALAGCATGGSNGVGSGLTSLPSIASDAASIANLAGRYHGTFSIKGKRAGDIDFNLTQNGTAIGGVLKLVVSKTYREPVAFTLDAANNSFVGNAVDSAGKTTCVYALSGSYNPKTFVLSGTSAPVTCSGKTAKFRTVESCYYNTGSSPTDRRPDARGILEC